MGHLWASCLSRAGWDWTFWIQQFGETQMLFGQVESVLQVVVSIRLLQFVKINQVRSWNRCESKVYINQKCVFWIWIIMYLMLLKCVPVFVNEGIESHAVPPAGGEVVDVDVGIAVKHTQEQWDIEHVNTHFVLNLNKRSPCGLHLTPQQQSILSWTLLFIVFCLHADVLDLLHTQSHTLKTLRKSSDDTDDDGAMLHLETEDDGPDETERKSVIPVHDIMRSHVLQMNPLLLQKLQSLVNVLQAVDAHTTLRWLGLQTDRLCVIDNLETDFFFRWLKDPQNPLKNIWTLFTTSLSLYISLMFNATLSFQMFCVHMSRW